MVTVATSLEIVGVGVQTIFPGSSVHFEFQLVVNGADPRDYLKQLVNSAQGYLRENNWIFDGITIEKEVLDFEHAEIEDFAEDGACWLEVPYRPKLGTGLLAGVI